MFAHGQRWGAFCRKGLQVRSQLIVCETLVRIFLGTMPRGTGPIRHPSCALPPPGWIPLAQVLAETGIDEHTLNNWRSRFLIPRPFTAAKQRGAISYYRPETVAVIRRIKELRWDKYRGASLLWRLWLEGHPVEMRGWAVKRFNALAAKSIRNYPPKSDVLGRSARGLSKDTSRRVRNVERLSDLVDAILAIAAGNDEGVTASMIETLFKLVGLPIKSAKASEIAGKIKPSDLEILSVSFRTEVFSTANDDEIEQARRDFQIIDGFFPKAQKVDWSAAEAIIRATIDHLTGTTKPEPPSWQARKSRRTRPTHPAPFIKRLAAEWRDYDLRAVLLVSLVTIRRYPDRMMGLGESLTRMLAILDFVLSALSPGAQRVREADEDGR